MTASVESKIAFATSLASARVGRGAATIDCSIWVAVITGRPRARASAMARFCQIGTCAAGISTPRSPRATMTASLTSRISSSRSSASRFSSLATSNWSPPRASTRRRSSAMSSGLRTNERATMSTSSSRPKASSSSSRGVRAGTGRCESGRFTPLREVTVPPLRT